MTSLAPLNLSLSFHRLLDLKIAQITHTKHWLSDPAIQFLFNDLSEQLQKTHLRPYMYAEHYGPYVSIAIPDLPHFTDARLVDLLDLLLKHAPTKYENWDTPQRNSRMFEFVWVGPQSSLDDFAPIITVSIEAVLKERVA